MPPNFIAWNLSFLMTKQKILGKQDTQHCEFLHGMIQTYCNLTSSDEPAFFDINQVKKNSLNQLIHFSSRKWEERKNWYCAHCHSAIDKKLSIRFVEIFWQKLKLPTSSIDYVQNIHAKTQPPIKMAMPPLKSKWTIDYTQTRTFFQLPWQEQWLCFLLALNLSLRI